MTPVAHILGFIVITRGRPLPVSNVKYPLVLQLIVVIVSDLDTAKPGVGLSHKIWSVTKASHHHNKKTLHVFPLKRISSLATRINYSIPKHPRSNYSNIFTCKAHIKDITEI